MTNTELNKETLLRIQTDIESLLVDINEFDLLDCLLNQNQTDKYKAIKVLNDLRQTIESNLTEQDKLVKDLLAGNYK